jgi:O-antigen/teichoic acid export membrane protein
MTVAANEERSLGSMAVRGVLWSLVQNWGGKALNFALFVGLARFLTPTDFGIAAAAQIIIVMITLFAEFGFSEAIIQRADLEREDVNLPFYASVGLSALLAAAVVAGSGGIESWLGVSGTRPVIVALAILAPISTVSLFQEMQYKRRLAFQGLALRVLVAILAAGAVSLVLAATGFGVWAIVAQTYIATLVGLVWMWSRPFWLPSLRLRPASFLGLARFSVYIFAMRVLDFGATRLVELITVGRYGVRAYGLYAASSRLNQTLLDMLQAALGDVSLSVLSRISGRCSSWQARFRGKSAAGCLPEVGRASPMSPGRCSFSARCRSSSS